MHFLISAILCSATLCTTERRERDQRMEWGRGAEGKGNAAMWCERGRIWTRVKRGSDTDLDVCEIWGTRGNGEGRQRKERSTAVFGSVLQITFTLPGHTKENPLTHVEWLREAAVCFRSLPPKLEAPLGRKEAGPEGQGCWYAAAPEQAEHSNMNMYIRILIQMLGSQGLTWLYECIQNALDACVFGTCVSETYGAATISMLLSNISLFS